MISKEQRGVVVDLWKEILSLTEIDLDHAFADLGGTSLAANQFVAQLASRTGITIPVIRVFEYPTLRSLLHYLSEGATAAMATPTPRRRHKTSPAGEVRTDHDIAIVGMACRFPGARNIDEFWQNLLDGRDSIRSISDEELSPAVPLQLRQDPNYVRACGLIDEPAGLDAEFFSINPMEAKLTDPQQRVLLETAWQAMEHAGEVPSEVGASTAVYAGVEDNSYYKAEILPFPEAEERAGRFSVMTANEKDYVAMRIAHKLNLKGPAVSVHTACSTSLVAIIMGCKSLRSHDCDLALAGGAAVHFPTPEGRYYQEGGVYSSDGHTRPFDKSAQGTNFTDGAGMVVLKRLEDALSDGNTIFAVIKGGAINSDGGDKVSFSAPSINGQANCIRAALADADVDAGTLQYLEAHGTATPVGDPIEVEALRQAFATRNEPNRLQYCGIGSVKSNIGHTTSAAGVASVIKTALALRNGVIPATVHFKQPNPGLDIENSPFYVVGEKTDWSRGDNPRRAGVSSFGIGGTNSHLILEEAPAPPAVVPGENERPFELWPVSARSPAQRDAMLKRLEGEKFWPRDVAHTLQTGRARFASRGARVRLTHLAEADLLVQPAQSALGDPRPVFMFPGQGAQYIGMGRSLAEALPEFRVAFTHCCDLLSTEMGLDFKSFIFDPENQETLENTRYTQPALFAIEVALGRMLLDWGIEPAYFVGHSIGEFAAAHLAGVFSLEDAVKLIAARGRLMSDLPRGRMLSARGPLDTILKAAGEPIDVASVNGPLHCVLAGDFEQVERVQARLESAGVSCRALHTSHAFHSHMMTPVVEPFLEVVRSVELHAPDRTIVSTVTGEVLTAANATDPMYWANHLRSTVNFSGAVFKALDLGGNIFLECGPRTTLTTLAVQHFAKSQNASASHVAISMLGDNPEMQTELGGIGSALARLWCAGVVLQWDRIWSPGRKVPLVTGYPFNRKNFLFSEGRQPELRSAPIPHNAPAHAPSLQRMATAPAATGTAEAALSAAPVMEQRALLLAQLEALFSGYAGVSVSASQATFVELGFDSLVLVQIGVEISKTFGVSIALRDLMERLNTLPLLAGHLLETSSPDRLPRELRAPSAPIAPAYQPSPAPHSPAYGAAPVPITAEPVPGTATQVRELLLAGLERLFAAHSGLDIQASPSTFLELGLDSLVLVQIGVEISKTFGVSIALRDLMARLNSLPALADHILSSAPPDRLPRVARPMPISAMAPPSPVPAMPASIAAAPTLSPQAVAAALAAAPADALQVMQQQLRAMQASIAEQLTQLEKMTPLLQDAARAARKPDAPPPSAPALIRARHAQPPQEGAFRAADNAGDKWVAYDVNRRRYELITR